MSSLVLAVYVVLWLRVLIYPIAERPLLLSLVLVLAVFATQWILLWSAYRLFLRREWWRWHSAWSSLVVVLITMVATGLVSSLIGLITSPNSQDVLVAETPAMWGQRVLALFIVTAAWSIFDDYRQSLTSERELQAMLENTLHVGVRHVEEQRNNVVQQVQKMLQEAFDEAQDGRNVSESFHHMARERLRPLSHDMAKAMPKFTPNAPAIKKSSAWAVIAREISSQPIIRPLLMALTVTFFFLWRTVSIGLPGNAEGIVDPSSLDPDRSGLSIQIDTSSLLLSLSYLLGVFVSTWVVGVVAVRLTRQLLPTLDLGLRLILVVVTPLIMAIVVEGLLHFVYNFIGQSGNLPSSFAQRLAFAIPIFLIALLILGVRSLVALLNVVRANQQSVTNRLEWEIARTNDTINQERKYLASQLHGPLQSLVSAVAMKLDKESGGKSSDQISISEARERLTTAIAELSDGPQERLRLTDQLNNIASTWKGLCHVTFDVSQHVAEEIDHDWVCSATVAEILTDAVANAVMHGKANNVSASIDVSSQQGCVLQVVDNGQAGKEVGQPGLGTFHLDELAVRWERDRQPSGTSLMVVLPVAVQSISTNVF